MIETVNGLQKENVSGYGSCVRGETEMCLQEALKADMKDLREDLANISKEVIRS